MLGDVGTHVITPLVWQALEKEQGFALGSDKPLVESPVGIPRFDKRWPCGGIAVPSGSAKHIRGEIARNVRIWLHFLRAGGIRMPCAR